MLELLGILVLVVAAVVFVLTFLANLGSETGAIVVSFWPAVALLVAGIALLVAHHFLRGAALHW